MHIYYHSHRTHDWQARVVPFHYSMEELIPLYSRSGLDLEMRLERMYDRSRWVSGSNELNGYSAPYL